MFAKVCIIFTVLVAVKAAAHLERTTLVNTRYLDRAASLRHGSPETYSSSSAVNHISAGPAVKRLLTAPITYSSSSHVAAAPFYHSSPIAETHAEANGFSASSHVSPAVHQVAAAPVAHYSPLSVAHDAPLTYSTSLAVSHAAPIAYSTSELNHVVPAAQHVASSPIVNSAAFASIHAAPVAYSAPVATDQDAPIARHAAISSVGASSLAHAGPATYTNIPANHAAPDPSDEKYELVSTGHLSYANAGPATYTNIPANHAAPDPSDEKYELVSTGHLSYANEVTNRELRENQFSGIAYGGPKSIHH